MSKGFDDESVAAVAPAAAKTVVCGALNRPRKSTIGSASAHCSQPQCTTAYSSPHREHCRNTSSDELLLLLLEEDIDGGGESRDGNLCCQRADSTLPFGSVMRQRS